MTAMPSTPSVKRMPHEGIHDESSTACHMAPRVVAPPQPERHDELDRERHQRHHARRAGRAGRDLVFAEGGPPNALRPDDRRPDHRDGEERRKHPLLIADRGQKAEHEFRC